MDDDKTEPTGPPPVKKGTPIAVKGAGGSEAAKPKPIKVEDSPAPEAAVADQTALAMPKSSVDQDLEAIDMTDEVTEPVAADSEQRSTPQFAPSSKKPGKIKTPGSKKKIVRIIVILIIIGAVAGAAWWLLNRSKNQDSGSQNTGNQTESSQNTTPAAQPETPTIKTYKSDTLMVELSYPSTWKTTEKTNQVVFSSPEISYTKKDGSTEKGSFRLVIQKGFSQADSTTINNAVAVKASELVKYAAPAQGQRTESYLSFLGPDKQTFTFMLISSGKQYNAGDTVAATLPLTQDSYLVFGGYGTGEGENIDFDALSPEKIQQSSAVYNQAVEIMKSLKITG